MTALAELGAVRPDVWVVTELPLSAAPLPGDLVARIAATGRLCVIEEHVAQGGVGAMLATWALHAGIAVGGFRHLHARGYPSGLYGSQAFHRRESGLDAESIRAAVLALAA
jgi:transketolase